MPLHPSSAAKEESAPSLAPATHAGGLARNLLRGVRPALRRKEIWSLVLALALGLALRVVWVVWFQDFDDDSAVYATLAKNLMAHHAYALDNPYHLTLVRMPGYPVFMAVVFSIFGIENWDAVCWTEALIDMGTCLLLAGFVRDQVSRRAALVTLWLACLCPFTANYAAVPLTECLSLFFIALGLFAAGRLIQAIHAQPANAAPPAHARQRRRWLWLLLTVASLIGSVGMRPDGGLLAAAIVPGIWWYTRKTAPKAGFRLAALCTLLTVLPLVPWTVRNYRVYHVFQPLAPRSATDPTETSEAGFDRWFTTWEIEFVSVGEIWWRGDETIDIRLMPTRAFDTPEEYRQTAKLIADHNRPCANKPDDPLCPCPLTPEQDARFRALAEQRIHRHPLRQFIELPLARLADMSFRPRIEYLNDAIPERWWEWSKHPQLTLIAIAYALLNLLLLSAGALGFARRRVPFAAMLLAYVLMRCVLLLMMPNAEDRYTLEFIPIAIIGAGVLMQGSKGAS